MGCGGSKYKADAASGQQGDVHGQFKLGGKLGEGSFGQVRIATKKGTGQNGAMKIIDMRLNLSDKIDPKYHALVKAEAECWSTVGQHPNCVELYETLYDGALCFLFMERCRSSLMDKLESMISAKQADLKDLFYQMLLGIQHCHSRKVVHRDIKPDNFLYGGDDGKTIKLCDFGLAAVLPAKGKLNGVYGTAPYMSPEMVGNSGHDYATDVWSFGATAYLMVYAEFPYMPKKKTARCMKDAILSDSPKPRYLPSENAFQPPALVMTKMIKLCLTRQAKSRVGMDDLLKNEFFEGEGAKKVAFTDPADENFEMQKVIRKARKHTTDFKKKVDPTVQKNLDELLAELQCRGNSFFNYFSEGDEQLNAKSPKIKQSEENDNTEGRIVNRNSRRITTHSGVVNVVSVDEEDDATQRRDRLP